VATAWTATHSVVIVGFVTNTGGDPITDIEVSAALIGRQGEDLARVRADMHPDLLLPGMRAPWRAEVANAPWQQGARARAYGRISDPETDGRRTVPLQIDAVTLDEDRTIPYASRLSGRVTNTGNRAIARARILAALIAIDGRPVAAGEDDLLIDELLPGQSAPFEVHFRLGRLPMIARYELTAEARPSP
jgi:hypothetical protein